MRQKSVDDFDMPMACSTLLRVRYARVEFAKVTVAGIRGAFSHVFKVFLEDVRQGYPG